MSATARPGELVLVDPAPEAGAGVAVSDLIPAVAGMKLRPRPDESLMRRPADFAAGRARSLGA